MDVEEQKRLQAMSKIKEVTDSEVWQGLKENINARIQLGKEEFSAIDLTNFRDIPYISGRFQGTIHGYKEVMNIISNIEALGLPSKEETPEPEPFRKEI